MRRAFLVQWVILLVALLILGGFIANSLRDEREYIESVAQDRLSLGAKSIALHVELRLISIDRALLDLQKNLPLLNAAQNSEAQISMYLGALKNAVDGIRTLGIFDAQGTTTASSRTELVGKNFSQREFFQAALKNKNASGLDISAPFSTSLGAYSLNLTRTLLDTSGEFSGIVTVTLDPEDFRPMLTSLRYTPDVSVGLVHGSGKVLIYLAPVEIPPGTDVSGAGTFFSRHLQSGKEHSLLSGFTSVLPNERLAAVHTVKPTALTMSAPLVIVVTQETESILREWRAAVLNQSILGALLIALASLGLFLHQRRQLKLARLSFGHQAERQRVEEETRNAQRVTQQFLDHLPGMAYVKNEKLQVLMANKAFQSQLGIDPATMIGKTNTELFPGAFGQKLDADDRQMLESGQGTLIQESFAGRHFESSKFIIRGETGQRFLGGVSLDVTPRQNHFDRQQAQLKISELGGTMPEQAFLGQGLEMVEQLTGSQIGFIHFVNDDQETIELVTWTAGALKGCTAVHESHYPMRQAGIWADCARTMQISVINDYAQHCAKKGLPEGHAPLHRLISVPVIEEGKVRVILGVGNKTSDYNDFDCATAQLIGNDLWRIVRRMRAEAELKHKLAELIALNARLDETNNKLLQSEKLAAIGQLAAGVAHEINNPIGYVTSNISTLASYVDDLLAIDAAYGEIEARFASAMPQAFLHARQIKAETDHDFMVSDIHHLLHESSEGLERVRKIVQDLKDFSRVGGAGWQWVNLHDGLESTLNIVWNEIKYKAEVDREYAELPEIHCIPSQINQVLMNLLTNAAQSIETHGHIVLRSGHEDSRVWIEVQDDGAGIAPENLERIFEPFFTTKPVGQGTGLGLSLSWGIIQRHHGQITVRSILGQGTTFRVILPVDPQLAIQTSVETMA